MYGYEHLYRTIQFPEGGVVERIIDIDNDDLKNQFANLTPPGYTGKPLQRASWSVCYY